MRVDRLTARGISKRIAAVGARGPQEAPSSDLPNGRFGSLDGMAVASHSRTVRITWLRNCPSCRGRRSGSRRHRGLNRPDGYAYRADPQRIERMEVRRPAARLQHHPGARPPSTRRSRALREGDRDSRGVGRASDPRRVRGRVYENTLLVTVNNSTIPNSRWYSGSGIYRHVRLHVLPELHIAPWGIAVTTPAVSPAESTVEVTTTVEDHGGDRTQQAARVRSTLLDAAGEEVAADESDVEAGAARGRLSVSNARLWSVDDPYLYTLETELIADGQPIDRRQTRVGIRSISFDRSGVRRGRAGGGDGERGVRRDQLNDGAGMAHPPGINPRSHREPVASAPRAKKCPLVARTEDDSRQ